MSDSLPKQKNLISISETAKFLGVSIDTVRRWDNAGVLHSERPDGKNRYFSLSELEEHKSGQPLSISEAAKELGVSPTTLRRLESRGLFKPSRNNAGERVYDKESINSFLKSDYFRRKNHESDYFRRKNHDKGRISADPDVATSLPSLSEETEDIHPQPKNIPNRIPEFLAAAVIFVLLSSIGATNITLTEIKNMQSSQTPAAVLSETITREEPIEESISTGPAATQIEAPPAVPTPDPVTLDSIQSLLDEAADFDSKIATQSAAEKEDETGGPDLADFKIMLSIKTSGADFIKIREKPSTESGELAKAKEGDTFEMVSRDSDWYEIKLDNKLNGFISEEFAQIKEIN